MFKKFCYAALSAALVLVLTLSFISFPAWASSAESNQLGSSLQLNEIDPSNYYDVVNVEVYYSYKETFVDVFMDDSEIAICNANGETLSQCPDTDSNAYYLWELIDSSAFAVKDMASEGSYNGASGIFKLFARSSSAIYLSEVSIGNYAAAVCFDLAFRPCVMKEVSWTPNVTVDGNIECLLDRWSISVFKQGSATPLAPDENGAYTLIAGMTYDYTISDIFLNDQLYAKYADIHDSFTAAENMSGNIPLTGKQLNEDRICYAVYLVVFDKKNPRVDLDCDIIATNQFGDTFTLRSSVNNSLSGFLPADSFYLEAVLQGYEGTDLIVSHSLKIK